MPENSFFWHDYETFGVNPGYHRASQFAGIRTNTALEVIGAPLVLYCQPAKDSLPSVEACLVTAITPQMAMQQGLIEPEFIQRILAEMAVAGTCNTGYNCLRFDDEFTRHILYRNFLDPYAREWQNNCSRWDIIDLARMAYALRPDGIEWPLDQNGIPSFRLELLSAANGISHDTAHNALSDVHATIGFAKRIRAAQPKLFDWLFSLRNKHKVAQQIDPRAAKPLVHTSRMYPASHGCTSLVMPLQYQSRNKSSVLVYDLRVPPAQFLALDEAALGARLFTPKQALPEGAQRLPIKSLKINKCPAIAPASILTETIASRIALDLDQCARHREILQQNRDFAKRIDNLFANPQLPPVKDVDAALYDDFIGVADRKLAQRIVQSNASQLAADSYTFNDRRLAELLFRYRARNWHASLSDAERDIWSAHCLSRYEHPQHGLEAYFDAIQTARDNQPDSAKSKILDALAKWGDALL